MTLLLALAVSSLATGGRGPSTLGEASAVS